MIKKITLFFSLILFSSCIKNIDLNQINDIELRPKIKQSFLNVNLQPKDFVIETKELNHLEKKTRFTVLKEGFIYKNLVKVGYNILIDNEFKRDFKISIKFLDKEDNVIYDKLKNIKVEAGQKNKKISDLIRVANIQNFLSIEFIDIEIDMSQSTDGSILDTNEEYNMNLAFTTTLYTKIKK